MKLSDLKAGDKIKADGGFTCVKEGNHKVKSKKNGDLYIKCSEGKHLLDGQVGEDGELIGISWT